MGHRGASRYASAAAGPGASCGGGGGWGAGGADAGAGFGAAGRACGVVGRRRHGLEHGSRGRSAWRSGRSRSSGGLGWGGGCWRRGSYLEHRAACIWRDRETLRVRPVAGDRGTSIRRSSTYSNITSRSGWSRRASGYGAGGAAVAACGDRPAARLGWRCGAVVEVSAPGGAYRSDGGLVAGVPTGRAARFGGPLGLPFVGRVFRDRFLIADVVMQAPFPTERLVLVRSAVPSRSSRRCCTSSRTMCGGSILQLGWDADPEEEVQAGAGAAAGAGDAGGRTRGSGWNGLACIRSGAGGWSGSCMTGWCSWGTARTR